MNSYQKRVNREARDARKELLQDSSFGLVRKAVRLYGKHEESPCVNCNKKKCYRAKTVMAYCIEKE